MRRPQAAKSRCGFCSIIYRSPFTFSHPRRRAVLFRGVSSANTHLGPRRTAPSRTEPRPFRIQGKQFLSWPCLDRLQLPLNSACGAATPAAAPRRPLYSSGGARPKKRGRQTRRAVWPGEPLAHVPTPSPHNLVIISCDDRLEAESTLIAPTLRSAAGMGAQGTEPSVSVVNLRDNIRETKLVGNHLCFFVDSSEVRPRPGPRSCPPGGPRRTKAKYEGLSDSARVVT